MGAVPQEARHSAVRSVTLPSLLVSPATAEPLLAVSEDLLGAAQRARQCPADPDLMLAYRLLVEERVEGDDTLHVCRREVELLGHELDDLFGHPRPVCVLAKVEHWDARRHLVRIAAEDLFELLVLLGVERKSHTRFPA